MEKLPFGQPIDGAVQFAYFVPDIQAGMKWWTDHFGVGPWFLIDRLSTEGGLYRGAESKAVFSAALAFSGHMMIELIQTLDEHPSVYKEARERNGYGFHHVAKMAKELPEAAARLEGHGYAVVFQAVTPSGGRVCFLEGEGPGLIELIEDEEGNRQVFTGIWRASVDWDGSRPVRNVAELLSPTRESPS